MIKDFHKAAIITADKEVSYAELKQYINDYATVTPKEPGAKTVIFSENREEWVYAFFSIWQNKGIAVPVDASSTVSDLEYILRDCTPAAIWVSDANEATARQAIADAGADVTVLKLQDVALSSCPPVVEETGTIPSQEDTHTSSLPEGEEGEDACAIIIYTSGTTGNPKGVMLSYRNLFANIHGVADEVPIYSSERRVMVLLPVHHVLPLMGTIIAPILRGGGIAICPSMTGPDIMATLCRGKVGIFIGVPRLWQVLYSGIKKKIDSSIVTRTLFNICKAAHSRALSRFVFQSIRKKMGGHLDFCVSGGAALDKEIGEGLKTLGLDVLEGYGMTETAPIITFTRPGDIIPGCVGLPLPSVECKIIDGELCAKGPNVMLGYYNRPEETAAVIDKDGFIHTGDLARFDDKGRVIITGRSKEIIVLSNGKNVQPNEIEYKLEQYDDKVKEAAVMQDGDMLRAIIVPQDGWEKNLSDAEMEEQLKREVIEPYNKTVENYKKLMRLTVYHGELPRTKLDKLQRFKLKGLLTPPPTPAPRRGNNTEGSSQDSVSDETAFALALGKPVETCDNLPDILKVYNIIKQYIESEKNISSPHLGVGAGGGVAPSSHIETDLAFDSLDKVGLQSFIEQTFGMTISADTMAEYKNIAAMAEHIAGNHTRVEVEKVDWHKVLMNENSHLSLPVAGMTHRYLAKSFRAFFATYNSLTVKGLENVPRTGPFIMAPNHQSYMDGALVMCDIPWGIINRCYFYATEEHVSGPVRRFLASRHNIIIMERRNLKDSILKMSEVLKQGKSIVIFPEGTRTHTGSLSSFKKTFAILSKELNVPILPVCISGAFEALPRGTHYIKPHHITVEYLPVINPGSLSYEELAQKVKDSIAERL